MKTLSSKHPYKSLKHPQKTSARFAFEEWTPIILYVHGPVNIYTS